MVQQPVQERGGQHLIAQEHAPLRKRPVTGEHNGCLFIARRHQIKEQLGLRRRQPQVAHLVNDQQLRTQIPPTLLAPTGGLEFLRQLPQRGKPGGVHSFQRAGGERQSEMRLPDSGWPQKHDISRRLHKAQGAQLFQEPLRHTGLKGKIKALQRFAGGRWAARSRRW